MANERRETPHPIAGAPVFTRDGSALGSVAEVSGDYFKVNAPHARDFWLSREFLLRASGASAELDFDAEVLGDYKLEGPGPVAAPSPVLDAQADIFDSAEEQREERRAMEHGYGPRDSGRDEV